MVTAEWTGHLGVATRTSASDRAPGYGVGRERLKAAESPRNGAAVEQPTDWRNVAVVHDYATQFGGAERVVLSMLRGLPGAPLYTSLFDSEGTYSEYADIDVRTLPLDNLRTLRRHHRLAFPLLAPSFSRLKVPGDVIICSSSGWAHGAKTAGRKIVYCHSPAKWLHQPNRYFSSGYSPGRAMVAMLRPLLGPWDMRAAASADRYLVNSKAIGRLVQDVYGVEAEVLPAPHSLDPTGPQQPVEGLEPGFFLCVSRLLPYKNVDRLVEAFADLPGERLVVVGSGPDEAELRQRSGENVAFPGSVDDASLRWLYQNCRAVVSASYEDFGLTPLEGAAFGRPAAVLRWGGFLDTVEEGETGLFFDGPEPGDISSCIRRLLAETWDTDVIRAHAHRFSEGPFTARLREVVIEEIAQL